MGVHINFINVAIYHLEGGEALNLLQPIFDQVDRSPDRVAISCSQEQLTYVQLKQRVSSVANGLRQHGVRHARVAILSANRIEFVEVFLGAIQAGCVPVLLDPTWNDVQLNAMLRHCQAQVLFVEQRHVHRVSAECSQIGQIVFQEQHFQGQHRELDAILPCDTLAEEHRNRSTTLYEQWMNLLEPEAAVQDNNELLFVGYTSGTTGMPKGYMRTHASWLASFEATAEAFQLHEMKQVVAPGPFVHSLSLFALVQSLYSGATFHIVHRFDAAEVLQLCTHYPEMILFVVPTMIDALSQQAIPGETRVQALISSGGKWTERSRLHCKTVFPEAKLYEYYGSSEASYISYMDVYEEKGADALGRPFHGVDISIRDDEFREVPVNTVGQLYLRSRMMFCGYDQLPEATAAVFRDGWLKVGDFVYLDEEGYLHMAGRSSHMIKTGGLKVFPEEVEAVLQGIPTIQKVMVMGVPDDRWGKRWLHSSNGRKDSAVRRRSSEPIAVCICLTTRYPRTISRWNNFSTLAVEK